MSYTAYDNGTAYLDARIKAVYANANIEASHSHDLLDFLERTSVRLNSYFISCDGFNNFNSYESRTKPSVKYSIFWHGRNMDSETIAEALTAEIHGARFFRKGTETRTASVTGGQSLLIDRGFDSYQLDIEIT